MPSPSPSPTLADNLRALGLRRTAEDLADLVARATKSRWSPTVLLEELARAETQDRARRSLERRLARAPVELTVAPETSGVITRIDARAIGLVVAALGGGLGGRFQCYRLSGF